MLLPKLKTVAILILSVITISLFNISPMINAQPLNLTDQQILTSNDQTQPLNLTDQQILTSNDQTQPLNLTDQQNFTQSLNGTFYRCSLSPHQPADPIEMETNVHDFWGDRSAILNTHHRVYTTFECNSGMIVLPPYNRDIVLSTSLFLNVTGAILGDFAQTAGYQCNLEDSPDGDKGNVTSCGFHTVQLNQTMLTGCSELPIEDPVEFNLLLGNLVNQRVAQSIFAQSHEYICHTPDGEKLKVVTIFHTNGENTNGFYVRPLSITCLIDIPSATFNGCATKRVDRQF